MTLEHRVGDLFNQEDLDAIAHGVNCQGDMSGGIAALFAQRYPEMYEYYNEICERKELVPGQIFTWTDHHTEKTIYNLTTQDQPGPDARTAWLKEALTTMTRHAENNGINSIGVPLIGAGIGGLTEDDTTSALAEVNTTTQVRIVLVTLD